VSIIDFCEMLEEMFGNVGVLGSSMFAGIELREGGSKKEKIGGKLQVRPYSYT